MKLPSFRRKPKPRTTKQTPTLDAGQAERLRDSVKLLDEPVPSPKAKPRAGRVIKQIRHAEFNPNPIIQGGRVIKVMPRKLQKIKQAQEKFEDDGDKLSVEDLED